MAKKVSNIIHQFDPVIYPRKLWIIKTPDENIVKGAFTDRLGAELSFVDDTGNPIDCLVMRVRHKDSKMYGMLVWIQCDMGFGTIAHEAFHVACDIFQDVEAMGDFNNQEPLAYLVGFAADCINQVVTGKIRG